MRQVIRWVLAFLAFAAAAAFITWLFYTHPLPGVPRDSGTRWGIALAIGAIAAAFIAVAFTEWAKKERAPAGSENERPALGRPANHWNPIDLGVHRAIDPGQGWQASDLPVLPPYVPRAHDAELRGLLAASGHSVMAVLVGGSSTGKTRACYEAVLAVPELAGWRIIRPAGDAELDKILSRSLSRRSLLWLNELPNYLAGERGPSIAARLDRLLSDDRQRVIVLGSMWQDDWRALTARPGLDGVAGPGSGTGGTPGRFAQVRELLGLSRVHKIDVPDDFSEVSDGELESLAAQDPRLAAALRAAGTGKKIAQVLAGGEMLVNQYERLLDHSARAVITAAMDARRLGRRSPLPGPLLEYAAPGYLTAAQRVADGTWFSRALAATEARPGIHALERHRSAPGMGPEDSYELHPYLDQYARKARRAARLPTEAWDALAAHTPSSDDRVALATEAEARRLYQNAVNLAAPAAKAGNVIAMCLLAFRFHDAGGDHEDEAERWLRQAAITVGNGWAGGILIRWLERAGRDDEVEAALREAAGQGHAWFIAQLTMRLQNAGRGQEADNWLQRLRQAAENDDPAAIQWWAAWLRETHNAGSETWLLRSAAADNPGAIVTMSELETWKSDNPAVEAVLRHAAERGDPLALGMLHELLLRKGRELETGQMWLHAAGKGSTIAMRAVAARLQRDGHQGDAERWLHRAADAGDANAMCILAGGLARRHHDEDTSHWLRQAAEHDHSAAFYFYAMWTSGGDGREDARAALTEIAETGDSLWAMPLPTPADGHWLREMAEAGSTHALGVAEFHMEQAGKHAELEQWLRQLLEAGVPDPHRSVTMLSTLLSRQQQHQEAYRLDHFGILPGGRTAHPW